MNIRSIRCGCRLHRRRGYLLRTHVACDFQNADEQRTLHPRSPRNEIMTRCRMPVGAHQVCAWFTAERGILASPGVFKPR